MTWLFIRFYIGVLAVLFLAWFIHGTVHQYRSDADLARVIWEAHAGGARLVAAKIDDAAEDSRDQVFEQLRKEFAYPVKVSPTEEAPESVREQFVRGQDVAYHRDGNSHYVAASMTCEPKTVWLGPFPNYRLIEVENAIGGWMRIAAGELESEPREDWPATIDRLRERFEVAIELLDVRDLPPRPGDRIGRGEKVVFFEQEPPGSDRHFSAIPVADQGDVLRFGPFPSFERIAQKADTTTLALVLLPAALAIAFLIRPVVRQLRHVEDAAKAIASGDLNARVDENRVHAVKPMANAFNLMADRTQSLLKSQRELLQAVSHELRTPLARIRFAADLIETAKSEQERQERLKAVDDATQQLDDLVGELLTYVRAESDAAEVEPEQVSVNELLAAVIDVNAPLHPAVQFRLEGRDDDVVVWMQRASLRRAISNLTRNAARFARSSVTLSTEQIDAQVRIRVDDDGPGIAEQDRERIFDPFVRLDENASEGSGLGLALVHRIITGQGGEIHACTSPQGGARFEIVIASKPLINAARRPSPLDGEQDPPTTFHNLGSQRCET